MTEWNKCPHLSGIKEKLASIESHSKRTFDAVEGFVTKVEKKFQEHDEKLSEHFKWRVKMEGFINGVKFTGNTLGRLGKYLWFALGGGILYAIQRLIPIAHALIESLN